VTEKKVHNFEPLTEIKKLEKRQRNYLCRVCPHGLSIVQHKDTIHMFDLEVNTIHL